MLNRKHAIRWTFALGFVLVAAQPFVAQTISAPERSSLPTSAVAQPADDIAKARSLADQGHLDAAEASVRAYVATHPNSGHAYFLLGYVLFREIQAKALLDGRTDQQFQEAHAKAALAEYTEGAKHEKPGAFDLKIVALNYVLLGDYTDADKWFTRSLNENPKDTEGWYYLGRAKYNEQLFEQAGRAFNECLRLDPENVKAEDNLGLAYAAQNRYDEAIAAYKKAISWESKSLVRDSGPYADLGSLLLDQNRTDEAIRYLSEAAALSPQESRIHAALGKAYSRTSELGKAQLEMEKAVQLAPDNASLHYVLGQLYRKLGLTDKAKVEFARTAELDGGHSSPITDLPAENAPK